MTNAIRAWNDFVIGEINREQTYRFSWGEKKVIIEARPANLEFTHCVYEAWFEGEDDSVSVGETPHEAFSDLL